MKKRKLTKEQLQKFISEGVKKIISESGAPAPTTTPTPTKTPSKTPGKSPNPIKIPKPGTFPKPAPKAKTKSKAVTAEELLKEWFRYIKLEQEKYRMKRLMGEALDIEPGMHQPHQSIKRGIEGQSEITTSEGRIDFAVQTKSRIFVFEFKYNSTPQKALDQIIQKKYASKYERFSKPITLVGIAFNLKRKDLTVDWIAKN